MPRCSHLRLMVRAVSAQPSRLGGRRASPQQLTAQTSLAEVLWETPLEAEPEARMQCQECVGSHQEGLLGARRSLRGWAWRGTGALKAGPRGGNQTRVRLPRPYRLAGAPRGRGGVVLSSRAFCAGRWGSGSPRGPQCPHRGRQPGVGGMAAAGRTRGRAGGTRSTVTSQEGACAGQPRLSFRLGAPSCASERKSPKLSVAQSPLYGVRTSPPVRVKGLPDPGHVSTDSGILCPSLTQFSDLSIKFC